MCWFAAYTKPRGEFKALDYFSKCNINSYVPEYAELRQWSDRIKKIRTPAISGYVFFELESLDYDVLNSNPFTRNIVKSLGAPVKIKDQEIKFLKQALKVHSRDTKFQYGDSVKIENGPFKNKLGKVDDVSENYITVLLNSIKVRLSYNDSKISLAQ
jgi:transcription antitermination factor NusG